MPAASIVVPVYNEAGRIDASLRTLTGFLERAGLDFEIVCVDDGSTDGSAAVLRRIAAENARVRVLTLPQNRGKGAAVRHGVLATRGAWVVFMDADLSTGLDAIGAAERALAAGAAVVLGSRRVPGARIVRRQVRIRESLGAVFSWMAAALIDRRVADFTCGFKAFSATAARAVFTRARIDGWAFDAEVVAIARALDLAVVTLPIEWRNQPGSKVRFPGAALSSLVDLVRIARWRRNGFAPRDVLD